MKDEGVKIGMTVLSPKYGEGSVMEIDAEIKTRRWIRKKMTSVMYQNWGNRDRESPLGPKGIFLVYHRLATVERYLENYRRLPYGSVGRRGGNDGYRRN